VTIAMMDEGGEFVVEHVCLHRETGKRLADMGFTQGAHGWIVRRGFLGGPLQVRLGDCDLMIRAAEAEGIDVEPLAGMHHCRGQHGGRHEGRHEGRHGMGRRFGAGPGRQRS